MKNLIGSTVDVDGGATFFVRLRSLCGLRMIPIRPFHLRKSW